MEFDDAAPVGEAICMGCLTVEEDVDDTLAFVELLKRQDGDGKHADATHELSEQALANLQQRQASGEPVRRGLAPERDAVPPAQGGPSPPAQGDPAERRRDG